MHRSECTFAPDETHSFLLTVFYQINCHYRRSNCRHLIAAICLIENSIGIGGAQKSRIQRGSGNQPIPRLTCNFIFGNFEFDIFFFVTVFTLKIFARLILLKFQQFHITICEHV